VFQPGELFDGKFRVERLLGQGGMGVVMVATHLALDQKVAIKVLHDRGAMDASVVERLQREARAAARLRSEHVCRVSDVGEIDGAPYIVMELLDGADLASVIARGPLPIATAVDYVLQACVAIAEAHALGIVHRDLKPANLFVTRRLDGSPLIKVLDFGIAKAQSANAIALTQTETMMGTPGYMSPEQLRSARDVDARTDLWALGCILYQAVSGRLPFPATSITEVAVKIAMDPPDPLDVDREFRDVVFHCLEKEPAKRPRNVAELAAALVPFGGPTAASNAALIARLLTPSLDATLPASPPPTANLGTATTVATAAGNPTTTLEGAAGQRDRTRSRRGRAALAIGGVLALVGIGAAAWSVTRSNDVRTTPSTTPTPTTTTASMTTPPSDAAIAVTPLEVADAAAAIAEAPPIEEKKPRSPATPPRSPGRTTKPTKPATSPTPPTIEDAIRDAQDAMLDARYDDALRIAKSVLDRDPGNRTARHVGVSAACKLRDAKTARELAALLPQKNRDDLAKVPCAAVHISLDEPTAPAAPATPDVAQAEKDVDRAIERHRCMEAGRIEAKLEHTASKDETKHIKQKVDACFERRHAATLAPSEPASEVWLLASIAELREQGFDSDASTLESALYLARMIDACTKGDAAAARKAAAKVAAAAKAPAITYCKGKQITIE